MLFLTLSRDSKDVSLLCFYTLMFTVVLLSFPLPFFFFVKEGRNSLFSGLLFPNSRAGACSKSLSVHYERT